jgi:hypothetical protein
MFNKLFCDEEKNANLKIVGWHNCFHCKQQFHSYVKNRKYCSHICYVNDQKIRIAQQAIAASKLPRKSKQKSGRNFICVICNKNFKSFIKSKYCQDHKVEAQKNKGKGKRKIVDLSKKIEKICLQCKTPFQHYKTTSRIYCSYKCHLDNGGAWRAGMAASGAKMKYGAKKDANHKIIVEALQSAGAYVLDMSHVGKGFPDLIVGFQSQTILMEIKNPKTSYGKKGLNKNQIIWRDQWRGGEVFVVTSEEEALKILKG